MKEREQQSFLFSFFSNIVYYVIAFPILKIVTKIVYDLKIEGIENIRNIEEPVISVSNHVLVLDCAMIGLAYGGKKVFYTTQEESFEIPFVRKLIKLLRAIAIPKNIGAKRKFIQKVNKTLKEGNCVHFYPEGSLFSYCKTIRPFKKGAFDLAAENSVPIVPMVYCFRKPTGIRRFFKRREDVTLFVLEPIQVVEENVHVKAEKLKEIAYKKMKNVSSNVSENDKKALYSEEKAIF